MSARGWIKGETFRGSVANHLPLAVLGKDPQKYKVKISILEIENRLTGIDKFRLQYSQVLEMKRNLTRQRSRRHIVRSAEC